jgi:S-adenosylmethionine uptake transporter
MADFAASNIRGALMALLAFGLYATHDAVVKYLGAAYSPLQIIFFSTLFAFPLLALMLVRDRTDGNLWPRRPGWVFLRAGVAVVNVACGFYAFSVLPLAQAYAIFFVMPMLVTLLAIPMLGERIGIRRGIAIAVGLVGVLIVLQPGRAPLGLGQLAALAAAATGAFVSVVIRKIGAEERSAVLMIYPMIANFVAMGIALPFVYRPLPVEHLGLLALMSGLGFLGGLSIIAAYRHAPAVIVAPMHYSQMLWAALYGWLFFGEGLDPATGLGAAVIVASGLYIVLREDTPRVSQTRPVLQSGQRTDSVSVFKLSHLLKPRDRNGTDGGRGSGGQDG